MKDILSKIVVTKSTLILAIICVAAIIINYYASLELVETLNELAQNKEQDPHELTRIFNSMQQYQRWVTVPLLLVSCLFPLFWAWQNYKVFEKKCVFVAAIVLIIMRLDYIAAIAVLLLYMKNFWCEFSNWRTNKIKSS